MALVGLGPIEVFPEKKHGHSMSTAATEATKPCLSDVRRLDFGSLASSVHRDVQLEGFASLAC